MLDYESLSALFAIIIIDLVLAGDNAVVIAMASRKLHDSHRMKAIYYGTFGAIVIRVFMTLIAVWLLRIPYLQAIGGLFLIPVSIKLLLQDDSSENINASADFWGAVKTIIFVDAVMGVDNVLAVAGAAQDSTVLVVLGLAISIPIVVWGSKWISAWLDKYPLLIYVGAGILAWTAGKMIVNDDAIGEHLIKFSDHMIWIVPLIVLVIVLSSKSIYSRIK